MATAARVTEDEDAPSDDSDAFESPYLKKHAGSMEIVRKTLNGISAKCSDNGLEGFGKHATPIRLGKELWETPALSPDRVSMVSENKLSMSERRTH